MDAREYFRRRGARLLFEHARACIGRRREAAALVELGVDGIRPRHVPQIGRGAGGVGDPAWRAALYRMTTAQEIYDGARARLADIDEFRDAAARLARGVGMGAGARCGEALELYYIEGLRWDEVCERMGCSRRHLLRLRDAGCEWADAVGWHRALRGVGRAQ